VLVKVLDRATAHMSYFYTNFAGKACICTEHLRLQHDGVVPAVSPVDLRVAGT
jgi:hypothetical protein